MHGEGRAQAMPLKPQTTHAELIRSCGWLHSRAIDWKASADHYRQCLGEAVITSSNRAGSPSAVFVTKSTQKLWEPNVSIGWQRQAE